MTSTFTKRGSGPQIEWEARGLAWLKSAGGAPVVEVLGWDDHSLTEEQLVPGVGTAASAEEFARRLWATHSAGASAFGCGPDGWDETRPGWIGNARLQLGSHRRTVRLRIRPASAGGRP